MTLNKSVLQNSESDFNIFNRTNWLIETNDPLTQILGLYLPGSSIISLKSLSKSSQMMSNSTYNELSKISKLKKDFKVINFGRYELKVNQSLLYLKRYFIAETTTVLVVNFDSEREYKFETIFKNFGLKNKLLNINYVNSNDTDFMDRTGKLTQVSVDKNGNCVPNDLYLPSMSSLVVSWPYTPPDLKDIL